MVERVMPDPWFRANNSPYTVSHGLRYAASGNDRPLVDGERRLLAFILPSFQRPSVWTEAQQIRLIESMWMGLPIAAYVYNQSDNPALDGLLLDGQQRWTAIAAYVDGAFPVFGHTFPSLPEPEKRRFQNMVFAALVTRLDTEAECRDVYDRLAYGGTAHDPASRLRDTPNGGEP